MTEIFWVIVGELGFYTGTYFTRREAIDAHCKALGKTWDYCRKKGDRAVKAKLETLKP